MLLRLTHTTDLVYSDLISESAMELPQIGSVKVAGGIIVLDEAVSRDPARVRGRISITLPGPEGPATFAGKFEVGVVVK